MGNGKCCSRFSKRVCPFIYDRGSNGILELHGKKWESERSQMFHNDFGWRNAGAEERRVRADWESVRKRAD